MTGRSRDFDVIVVGLGAHGAATSLALARRGRRVLGLDRFSVPHTNGSTHGESRIIRQAYHEHPAYVPFVQRAYTLWEELAEETKRNLMLPTGGLFVGRPQSIVVRGALESARLHRLPHETLGPPEVGARFPPFRLDAEEVAVVEPRAAVLRLPESHAALIEAAKTRGATIRTQEEVTSWSAREGEVKVATSSGEYRAGALVIAAGAWLPRLVPQLVPLLRIERQVVAWFRPGEPKLFRSQSFPIFIWDRGPRGETIYGFPDLGNGVKAGIHHAGETVDPDAVSRIATARDAERLRRAVGSALPALDVVPTATSVCLYTNTPDEAFLLDRHPRHDNVLVVSCCSGHGYKFAPAVGEAAAALLLGERPSQDLALFRLSRFPDVSW